MLPDALRRRLVARLDDADALHQRRRLRPVTPTGRHVVTAPGAAPLLNLAGNDYLALAHDPRLATAARAAITDHGTGAGASRLVTGTHPLHAEAEAVFTALKHPDHTDTHASLLLPTGYTANLALLTALAVPGDLVLLDKLCHASLIDAARHSGAAVRTFRHLDIEDLRRKLAKRPTADDAQAFVVTDSVFSMDGDHADLPALCDAADAHDAAVLVDEAHGTGVLGDRGAGLAEAQGVAHRITASVSTASKALGGLGGVITAGRPLIDALIQSARAFHYTTAVPPAQAAAVIAALGVVRDEPQRRERLAALSATLAEALAGRGWTIPPRTLPTPIVPLITGDNARALALAAHLETQGLLAVAIRPPTVAPHTARIRLTLRSDLTDGDLTQLLASIDTFHPPA